MAALKPSKATDEVDFQDANISLVLPHLVGKNTAVLGGSVRSPGQSVHFRAELGSANGESDLFHVPQEDGRQQYEHVNSLDFINPSRHHKHDAAIPRHLDGQLSRRDDRWDAPLLRPSGQYRGAVDGASKNGEEVALRTLSVSTANVRVDNKGDGQRVQRSRGTKSSSRPGATNSVREKVSEDEANAVDTLFSLATLWQHGYGHTQVYFLHALCPQVLHSFDVQSTIRNTAAIDIALDNQRSEHHSVHFW